MSIRIGSLKAQLFLVECAMRRARKFGNLRWQYQVGSRLALRRFRLMREIERQEERRAEK